MFPTKLYEERTKTVFDSWFGTVTLKVTAFCELTGWKYDAEILKELPKLAPLLYPNAPQIKAVEELFETEI